MILRLRLGCLRWQHSENADGREQLRKTENMPLCEGKRGRETKRAKEEVRSAGKRETKRERKIRRKIRRKKLRIREDESERRRRRRRRRRPIAAVRWNRVGCEGRGRLYFILMALLAAHTEATKTWSAVQSPQSNMTTRDFVSSFIHERLSLSFLSSVFYP